IEVIGDKVPAVDHALDMLSTVLRPAAGTLLAASVMWEVRDPLTALALGVAVGAPSAAVPHAAKTVLRAASTTFTGGLANPLISVFEDVLAVGMFVLTVVVPLLAATTLLVVAFLVVRRMARRSAPAPRAPAPRPDPPAPPSECWPARRRCSPSRPARRPRPRPRPPPLPAPPSASRWTWTWCRSPPSSTTRPASSCA